MGDSLAGRKFIWKIRKVVRYIRLYGLSRTAAKVEAQRHLARTWAPSVPKFNNDRCKDRDSPVRFVAIVGCGNFAYSTIAYYLKRENASFLRATYDTNFARSVSLCKAYGGAYAARNLDEILNDDAVELVYISSNHASHAAYASAFRRAGKAVHIEKPHAVTEDQLAELAESMERDPSLPVFLGYNRPRSSHYAAIAAAVGNESGPFMVNWFVAGHEIPDDHWYFADSEGGRVLGNLCHWLDLSMQLVGDENVFPCTIVPSSRPDSKSDYALTIDCADGSLICISFSAKGHTFEGVREVMSLHRGDSLVLLRDFEETRLQSGASSTRYRTRFRDHGHGANVLNSYRLGRRRDSATGESRAYVLNSGHLSLGARQALEKGVRVVLHGTHAHAPGLGSTEP